ncbi:flagellar protein FlaG [Chitinimonas sp. BJYL2]|uniref:flagellar protein FlaG n=1 Tax=Chitinimonas sp. BJYL2 TaxID=2976696 RepID=UPI0022B559BD|nr:flagellar protein FlaG [Chitinimonas sp. BJYL2]
MQVQATNVSLMQPAVAQKDGQAKAVPSAEVQAAARAQAAAEVAAVAASDQATENPQSVQESVKKLNETIAVFNRNIQFSIDDDSRRNIVRIVDVNSKEVIRQIPSKEVIEIAQAIDKLKGLLFSDKA